MHAARFVPSTNLKNIYHFVIFVFLHDKCHFPFFCKPICSQFVLATYNTSSANKKTFRNFHLFDVFVREPCSIFLLHKKHLLNELMLNELVLNLCWLSVSILKFYAYRDLFDSINSISLPARIQMGWRRHAKENITWPYFVPLTAPLPFISPLQISAGTIWRSSFQSSGSVVGNEFFFHHKIAVIWRKVLFTYHCTVIGSSTLFISLQMAGTIVTYELVLLQFDEETRTSGNVTFCDTF